MHDKVLYLAKDLTCEPPRSPHETLGGFVIAARTLDKCRAKLAGTLGEYIYGCALDNFFFTFSGINAQTFENFVAQGAEDDGVAAWIRECSDRSSNAIKIWNLQLRQMRLIDLPPAIQVHLEDYITENLPPHCRPYSWFDVYDMEEGVI